MPQTVTATTFRESEGTLVRSRWSARVGLAMSVLALLFLVFDASMKLFVSPEAVAGTAELGWPTELLRVLGVLQLVLWVLYAIPRTAIIGAVLWTGYLGGAIATHLRIGNPWPSHILFPVYVALLLWGGLWLRDQRVRALIAKPR